LCERVGIVDEIMSGSLFHSAIKKDSRAILARAVGSIDWLGPDVSNTMTNLENPNIAVHVSK
jgi:hypothetical protein